MCDVFVYAYRPAAGLFYTAEENERRMLGEHTCHDQTARALADKLTGGCCSEAGGEKTAAAPRDGERGGRRARARTCTHTHATRVLFYSRERRRGVFNPANVPQFQKLNIDIHQKKMYREGRREGAGRWVGGLLLECMSAAAEQQLCYVPVFLSHTGSDVSRS